MKGNIFIITIKQKDPHWPTDIIIWSDDEDTARKNAPPSLAPALLPGSEVSEMQISPYFYPDKSTCRKLELNIDYTIVDENQEQVDIILNDKKIHLPKNKIIDPIINKCL